MVIPTSVLLKCFDLASVWGHVSEAAKEQESGRFGRQSAESPYRYAIPRVETRKVAFSMLWLQYRESDTERYS